MPLVAATPGHPPRRRVPSEKRIRTFLQQIDAARLDELTGSWLRALADVGKLENLLTWIAIDGKWLRGIGDGQQVKLFSKEIMPAVTILDAHCAGPADLARIARGQRGTESVHWVYGPVSAGSRPDFTALARAS